MPNLKSAKKELRKAKKRNEANTKVKDNLKKLVKKSRKAIDTKEMAAEELVKKTLQALDKAAKKKVIDKNASRRKKSRLQRKLNFSRKA